VTVSPNLSILLVGDYPDDPRLGSSKVFHKLRDEFVRLGHDCDVLWSDDIGRRPASRHLRQLVSPWLAANAIAARTGRRKYHVIDAASAEGLFVGLLNTISRHDGCAFVCRSNGLEHLNYARMIDDHAHGLTRKPWTRRLWYPATRLSQVAAAARLADRFIVLNERDRTFALDRGWQPPERIALVPHGISDTFLESPPPVDAPRGAGILFCGTWHHVKGIAYLAAALNRLHAAGQRVPLTVLGPGVEASTVLADFDPLVRPFVTVIERAAEDRVMAEYRRHDMLLWTSSYEGFGLVLIEAMSQRLPVITTASGYAATVLRDGENGLVVPFRDPDAIVSAVTSLLSNPDRRRQLGDRGRDAVAGLSWRTTARRVLDVYNAARADLVRR
jgi:glycosyltransferase involved in cell wall biosynthesis